MFDESICLNHCKLMGGRGGEGVESHMQYPMAFSILHNNNVTKVRQKTKW